MRTEPLRVGISPWPGYDIIYYAQHQKWFEENGLHIKLKRFENLEDASRAFLRGQLDAVFSSSWDVMHFPQDYPIDIILVTNQSSGADGIVSHPNVKTIKELSGKKVACQLNIISHTILMEALKLHNVNPEEVTLVDVGNELGRELLIRGEVDAAVMWEPMLSKTSRTIAGNILFTTREVNSNIIDNLITRQDLLPAKRAQLKQFVAIWFDVISAIQRDSKEVLTQTAVYIGQDPESFIYGFHGLIPGDMALNRYMLTRNGGLNNVFKNLQATMPKGDEYSFSNVNLNTQYLPLSP